MKRRDILATTVPLGLLPAGCLRVFPSRSDSRSYESANLVELGWQEESPLVGGLSPHSETDYYIAIIDSPSDSDVNQEYLRRNDGRHLLAFLDETSFETERILALQARHTNTAQYFDADSLDVDVGERIEGAISIGSGEGGGGAENRETLFVRIEVGSQNPTGARITIREDGNSAAVTTG